MIRDAEAESTRAALKGAIKQYWQQELDGFMNLLEMPMPKKGDRNYVKDMTFRYNAIARGAQALQNIVRLQSGAVGFKGDITEEEIDEQALALAEARRVTGFDLRDIDRQERIAFAKREDDENKNE